MKPRTYTMVLQIEAEPGSNAKTLSPGRVCKAIMDALPLGEVVAGHKIKGAGILASGVRAGYISGVGR